MPFVDTALKAELTNLYAAPDRHYHNIAHIEALLALTARHRAEIADPDAVEAAIWFHDAIYDSRAKDSETRSAALAAERLASSVEPERLAKIVAMIDATATHHVPDLADPAAGHDAALLLDMDLSILGAEPAAFDAYESQVRREYGWVPEDTWRAGRAAVLRNFLARPFIFHTETFRGELEQQARANMARSLAALTA